MRFQLKISAAILFSAACAVALADTAKGPVDFNKTVLPILKDSCFACHLPGADKPYASKDPQLTKQIKKVVGDGLENLTMGDKFPLRGRGSRRQAIEAFR